MQQQHNPTPPNRIYALFPDQALISVKSGAAAIGWAEKTVRNMLSDGTFPIKTVRVGHKRLVVVADLARYYSELVGLGSVEAAVPTDTTPQTEAPRKRGRGRPRKEPRAEGMKKGGAA